MFQCEFTLLNLVQRLNFKDMISGLNVFLKIILKEKLTM